jgi:VanZ family protein/O-antigen ligase
MKQIRPLHRALVALLMITGCSSTCAAGVIVLSNRTQDRVGFVLAEENQDRDYTLDAGELRALRISSTTRFWFDDDVDNGYSLRSGCAYIILWDSRQNRRELHRIGLAAEQAWLEKEAKAEPHVSVPENQPGPQPAIDNPGDLQLQVTLAFETTTPDKDKTAESRLRAVLEKASEVTTRQCGVAFEAVDFQRWQSDPSVAGFDQAWRELVAAVPAQPGRIVIGFTARPRTVSPCLSFPTTAAPLASHLLIYEDPASPSEHERLESLLHVLGHYLGAAHSPESGSVMRPELRLLPSDTHTLVRFDPINALAMALVGEDLATMAPRTVGQISPSARERLHSIYATLAEALPADPLADRLLELLETAPVRMSGTTDVEDGGVRPHTDRVSTADILDPPLQAPVASQREQPDEVTLGSPTRIESRPAAERIATRPHSVNSREQYAEAFEPETKSDLRVDESEKLPALGLALILMGIPAALLIWRFIDHAAAAGHTAYNEGDEAAMPRQPPKPVGRVAWSAYLASVAVVAGLVATSTFSSPLAGFKAATLLLFAGIAVMTIAPLYPIAGPLVFLVLSYGVQGDDPAAVRIGESGVIGYLAILAPSALGLRLLRERRRPRPPRDWVTWTLLAMMAWVGLSVAWAAINGLPSATLVHRAARFSQVLVFFLVTSFVQVGLAELRLSALVLALTLLVRVHVFRADVSLEQNLAMLAAIACPLLFVTANTAPSRAAKLGFGLLAAYFVALIVHGQNRAAMVALPIAAMTLLLLSRYRLRALLIAVPLVVGLAVWLPSSGWLDRFGEIYQEGEFKGSAYFRLRIWKAGWHMARHHAGLGVGPGNFEMQMEKYDPDLWSTPSHNSFVEMGAETGLFGLAFYVALILAASLRLVKTALRYGGDWRGLVAAGILASLWAHVATGCFVENPSLAATYVLLAMGTELSAAPVTRVYRERLHLPLPEIVANPLANLVVKLPRVVSGMPVGSRTASRRASTEATTGQLSSSRHFNARWLWALLAVYAVVVVAGSLSPFSLRPMGLHAAMDLYRQEMSRTIQFLDRSDWLANFMLFVPLGFLAMAAACSSRKGARRLLVGALSVSACFFFSSLIELAQIWFASRSVNPNDVAAESLGAVAGVVAFFLCGDWLVDLLSAVWATRNSLRAGEKLLVCYAVGVLFYATWPLDITINPTDFGSKLRDGRIDFRDWAQPGWFAGFAVSAALMAPIGVLLRTIATSRGQPVRRWPALLGWGVGWLLAVESLRLLAFSQSVGLLHLAGGAAGILFGGLAGSFFDRARIAT